MLALMGTFSAIIRIKILQTRHRELGRNTTIVFEKGAPKRHASNNTDAVVETALHSRFTWFVPISKKAPLQH